jgi:hypothetical protein
METARPPCDTPLVFFKRRENDTKRKPLCKMKTQIHPKRMKSLGLREQLRNETHRKHLKQRKKN